MGTFLVYILKSSLCLALFYLFYRLLLSKETFHRFNRIALLGVMLTSFGEGNGRPGDSGQHFRHAGGRGYVDVPLGNADRGTGRSGIPVAGMAGSGLFIGNILFFVAQSLVVGAYALPDSPQPLPADGERYLSGYPSGGIRSFQLDEIHCHFPDGFG